MTERRKKTRRRESGSATFDQVGRFLTRLTDMVDATVLAGLRREIEARMGRVPTRLNAYGYDPWGLNRDFAAQLMLLSALLYRYWFRVETHGIERLPKGRMLIIGNHAGQVALDAAMIAAACFLEAEPPRILRGMGEYWLPTVPFVNVLMVRSGSVVGTPKNCVDLLANDEAVIAFPEGVRGMNKLYREAYKLQEFGLGFMRLAIRTNTPIVPVAVVGSEEQAPGIANLRSLGRLLGMPAFPITLTWPWLGPLGLIPLPVKYRIHFGAPMHFTGDPDDEDEVIARQVDDVKGTIQRMLERGVKERVGVFF
jgi:1-acyl-sn-glycerol-3-phosphate acyltransferase